MRHGRFLSMSSVVALAWVAGCHGRLGPIRAPVSDTFDRATLGSGWNPTSGAYRITDGQLEVSNAFNHPAWLRARLPPNVVIDLDATSKSPDGDIKVELYGDGASFDPDKGSYDSTGYVLIFGGWHNSLAVICKQEEHGAGRKALRNDVKVTPGQRYHFTITRKDGVIDWAIDGRPFLRWKDPAPLSGPTHQYFAVNDWQADVLFDNLKIRPLP